MRREVTYGEVVALLNEALACDPVAVSALVNSRVPCNVRLADHPTIQVGTDGGGPDNYEFSVGLLGILNGLFGTSEDGRGALCAIVEDDGLVLRFELVGS